MKTRLFLILILLVVNVVAQAAAIVASDVWVIRLDGREYAMVSGSVVLSSTGVVTLQNPNFLSTCRRTNGQSFVSGPGRLVYDSVGRFLYLQSPEFTIEDDALVLSSTTGDVECANSVAAEAIFGSGFE